MRMTYAARHSGDPSADGDTKIRRWILDKPE